MHVETTSASTTAVTMTAPIHEALAAKALLPSTHVVDAGDIDATLLVSSPTQHQVNLVGPVRTDVSWQARAGQGYDIRAFRVDWEAQTATCPAGHTSVTWHPMPSSILIFISVTVAPVPIARYAPTPRMSRGNSR